MAKKKSKRDDYEDEDDDLDEGRGSSSEKKPGADAYTGLVVITTLCLIVAAVMLYLDGDKFANVKGANPIVAPNALVAAPAAKS